MGWGKNLIQFLANTEMEPDGFWTESNVAHDKAILNIQLLLGQPWCVNKVSSLKRSWQWWMEGLGWPWSLAASSFLSASDACLCQTKKKDFIITSVIIMICVVYFTQGRMIVCCHDYLIHRFTPDHRGGFKLYCFLLFSVMVHRKALRSRTKDYMKLEVI